MASLPFIPAPQDREVVMITECEGAFVVEPMRFLYPFEAKREAKAKVSPLACHHRCRTERK
jgi:hypothetical protein